MNRFIVEIALCAMVLAGMHADAMPLGIRTLMHGRVAMRQAEEAPVSQTWTVTFDANGGEGGWSRAMEYGAVIEPPVVKREGYAFAGWSPAVAETVPGSNVTYTAQWKCAELGIDLANAYETSADGTFALDLQELLVVATMPRLTFKGLPTGLKYDAKKCIISGKATKPGVYKVTVSATNATVKKPVTSEFEIVVPNLRSEVLSNLAQDKDAYGVVMCGVAIDPELIDCTPKNGWTVKVAGLPAGLKFTAKDIMKKGSKKEVDIPANTIYGVPTKAGTFTVTFTVTKKGEEKQTATITLKTEALPMWATGTFMGSVKCRVESGELEEELGSATMTIAANGKVSGKIALEGTNWTFGAASYAAVRRAGVIAPYQNGGEECFIVEAVAKAGKATMPVVLEVVACDGGGTGGALGDRALPNGVVEGTFGEGEVMMWRNMWKDKATAAVAKAELAKWEGLYTLSIEDGGYLSLNVGKTGDVKAGGKLSDGTKVSATSPLMYDDFNGWFAYFYAAPSAYKGGSFAITVGFDGPRGALVMLDWAQWTSRNPQATGVYGEGFVRELDFTGAYYDKTKKLNDHYNSLWFSADLPTLNGVEPQNDGEVEITIDAKGKPVIDKASGLTLSFAQATGIFKGGYTFIFDAKTKKKVSFEGILVPGEESLRGFYLWDAASSYADPKNGKTKTYKYKESHPVTLTP